MAIGSDYSQSIIVNGYMCHSCADVALAARHVDPAGPPTGARNEGPERDETRNHFSPEARDRDLLAALHEQGRTGAANPYAAAYGAVGAGAAPGQFVDRTG
jgi:hypothetical protein